MEILAQFLHQSLNPDTKTWPLALLVLALSFFLSQGLSRLLDHLSTKNLWITIGKLSQDLSHLALIIGLKLASELSPLQGRVETWINGSIYIFAVFILMRLLEKTLLLGIDWSVSQVENTETLKQGFLPLIRNLITIFVFLSGGILILNYFRYDAMSLITALGVSSLAVGLAAKETLSNMISGFTLIIDRNLKPGDLIEINGLRGTLREIGLRSTQISLIDGNSLIVPNTDLINTKIINLSSLSKHKLCSTQLRAPYSASFVQIRTRCETIIKKLPTLHQSSPMSVNLTHLSDGHQVITVSFWVNHYSDMAPSLSEFHTQILEQLQYLGIELISIEAKPSWIRKP